MFGGEVAILVAGVPVTAGLWPLVFARLAHVVLRERVTHLQVLGMMLALTSVAMITTR